MKDIERRNTKQRNIILNALQGNYKHPTAKEVYDIVKKQYPDISMGTVYRNLDVLAGEGKISKIKLPSETYARFDFQTNRHYHIKCVSCGKVVDITLDMQGLNTDVATKTGFSNVDYHINFTGLCKECRGMKDE